MVGWWLGMWMINLYVYKSLERLIQRISPNNRQMKITKPHQSTRWITLLGLIPFVWQKGICEKYPYWPHVPYCLVASEMFLRKTDMPHLIQAGWKWQAETKSINEEIHSLQELIKGLGSTALVSHSVLPSSLWPRDGSPAGTSVHGTLQARILEWVAILSCRWSSQPRDWTLVSCPEGRFLYHLSHQGSRCLQMVRLN